MGNTLKLLDTPGVQYLIIPSDNEGQRLDNFLITLWKGVPKSRIYRIIRKGEVRINKKRIAAFYRLMEGDRLRLPPVRMSEKAKMVPPSQQTITNLTKHILYEDETLLIINKPAGMAVHGGTTVRIGIIEALRHAYPKLVNLELAHRLDSDTSGCLILAKKKRVLRELHELLREGHIEKIYWALTKGKWKHSQLRVEAPLRKDFQKDGKHVVTVHPDGKNALTIFNSFKIFKTASLMEVRLMTGRTHQIRVHATHLGHPIAGDERYGENEFNHFFQKLGLKRMFLHARSIDFVLPSSGQRIRVTAPLPAELETCLTVLEDTQNR